jgi:predicted Zn-ribbon and HTH transcriptional regulator
MSETEVVLGRRWKNGMNLKRKIERKQKAAKKKAANRAVKEIGALMEAMPNGCLKCGSSFSPREHPEQLDSWRIKVSQVKAELTCPECQVADVATTN